MIAYLILAHANPEPLRQLVEVLGSDDRSRIYLHFDGKAVLPDWCGEVAAAGALTLVPRVAVNWAGYSMIRAMCSLMSTALDDPRIERLVMLSGNSCPLRPIARINDEIMRLDTGLFALWKTVHGERAHGEGAPDGGIPATRRERQAATKFYPMDVACLNPINGKLRRQVWKLARALNGAVPYARSPTGLIVKGSQWFCATRSEAAVLLDDGDGLSARLRHSFAPDEMLFQTRWFRQQLAAGRSPAFGNEDATTQAIHYIPNHVPPRVPLFARLRQDFDRRRMTLADIEPALRSPALFARKCPPDVAGALRARVAETGR